MDEKRRIPSPALPKGGRQIVDVSAGAVKGEAPCIGITYLEAKGDYGLKGLAERARRHNGSRQIYKELDHFLHLVRQYKSIEELIDKHCPKKGAKNRDEASRRKIEEIQKCFGVETGVAYHIHCNGNGNGAFVLHGFVIRNRFEIFWIDPCHEIHS